MSLVISEGNLPLLKRHCAEWKSLFASEINSRHRLGIKQKLEIQKLQALHKNCHVIAAVIKRHISEIIEFNNCNAEKRFCLKDKHFCEKFIYQTKE